MRLILNNSNGVMPEQIEFEAKIGTIQLAQQGQHSLANELVKHLLESESWHIMPEAKAAGGPAFYFFNSDMPNHLTVSHSEIFDALVGRCHR